MDEQTREAALTFWNEQVMDRNSPCYGDIVLGAVEALAHFHVEGEGGFEALGLALRDETARRIREGHRPTRPNKFYVDLDAVAAAFLTAYSQGQELKRVLAVIDGMRG